MPLPLAIASYFMIWWVVLFAVLPFRVRSAAGDGRRSAAGIGPRRTMRPYLAIKALATTLIAAVVFAALYAFVVYEG